MNTTRQIEAQIAAQDAAKDLKMRIRETSFVIVDRKTGAVTGVATDEQAIAFIEANPVKAFEKPTVIGGQMVDTLYPQYRQ